MFEDSSLPQRSPQDTAKLLAIRVLRTHLEAGPARSLESPEHGWDKATKQRGPRGILPVTGRGDWSTGCSESRRPVKPAERLDFFQDLVLDPDVVQFYSVLLTSKGSNSKTRISAG